MVRVASVLEAIGELSLPDESNGSAGSVVVLGGSALDEAPGPELADAIRLADPKVQILRVGNGADDSWCDGVVDDQSAGEAASAILRAVGLTPGSSPGSSSVPSPVPSAGASASPQSPAAPAVSDEPESPYPVVTSEASRHIEVLPPRRERRSPVSEAPAVEQEPPTITSRPVAAPSEAGDPAVFDDDGMIDEDVDVGAAPDEAPAPLGAGWAVGDRVLVSAALRGADVLEPAMDLLRRRVNRRDVDFLPADAAAREDDDVRLGVPVVWEGRPLGMLIAGDADRATLASLSPHAAWLAGWLRLSRQSRGLRRAAFTDPLTGAWNRRYFERFLDAAIAKARQDRLSLTVLMFDIDDFKGYNDRYGHPAGDEILIEAVRVLRSVIRPSDRVCRIGGDEFAVVFFEPQGPRNPASRPPESVYVLTKRVQQKIREREFPKLGREAAGRLTISGGLATYPWDGADSESLLARADELAIQSKRAGKNAITFGPGAERINGPQPAVNPPQDPR